MYKIRCGSTINNMTESFKELFNILEHVESSTNAVDHQEIEKFALRYADIDEDFFINCYLEVDRVGELGMERSHIENVAKSLYKTYKEKQS